MNIILITGMFVFFRLPEVPPDTAETNPIMRHNEIHKFSQLSPDSIITGCAKMSLEFISRFDDLTESLGGNLPDISLSRSSGLVNCLQIASSLAELKCLWSLSLGLMTSQNLLEVIYLIYLFQATVA